MASQMIFALILMILSPSISSGSCSGVKGCNPCYDTLLGTTIEDVQCGSDKDCIAIEHRCGDFYALNKKHAKKFIRKDLGASTGKKIPLLVCKFDSGWGTKICQQKK